MSDTTIAGSPVLCLHLTMPPQGTWLAKGDADREEDLTGSVTLDDGEGNLFVGRVRRSHEVTGRNSFMVAGGKGKLADGGFKLATRHFRAVNAKAVAQEILSQAGETLSPTAQTALLSQALEFWSIGAITPGAALAELVAPFGGTWRVLDNGSVWLGIDSFPKAPDQDRLELNVHADAGVVPLAVDAFSLRPGVTLDTRRVLQVEHMLTDEGRRTDYWYG